jgi:DHA3 family macrolide efflux protein-like MFS transporter
MSTSTTAPAAPEPMSMGAVLRIPTMRRLWYAAIVSNFGDFLALFAVISVLTFELHATAQQVTGVQISYMLPIAVLSVLAGVFVDRWPIKTTLVVSDFTRCALCLLLLLAHSTFGYYLVLAAISVVSSFFGPAQGVTLRSAVPAHGLRSANALMQQVMFGMRIIGPAIAALLVARLGPKSCYIADAASFLASGCLIASLAISRPQAEAQAAAVISPDPPPPTALGKLLADMRVGISFIFHHAGMLFVLLAMAAGMFVLGCFGPLIAVYVRDSVRASTQFFGIASGMIGVGMLIGVNGLTTFGKRISNTVLVYSGLAGIALALAVLSAIARIWATVAANCLIGLSVAGIIVPATTMMQQETPQELMGRVGSAFMSLIFTAQICGLILSGILANTIGVRHVFAVCAVLLVFLIAGGRLWMDPHRKPAGSG